MAQAKPSCQSRASISPGTAATPCYRKPQRFSNVSPMAALHRAKENLRSDIPSVCVYWTAPKALLCNAGDLVYMSLLGQPFLVVNSAKVASDLFEKRSNIYSDRPEVYSTTVKLYVCPSLWVKPLIHSC